MKTLIPIAFALAFVLPGCSATQHRSEVADPINERLTVGTVQREIHVGMSSAGVASVLGAPNIVSTDGERREVWVYDKFATQAAYSRSSAGIAGLVIGSSGAGGTSGSKSAGAASTNQRTLTIVIKFDEESRVRDFSYRTSSF